MMIKVYAIKDRVAGSFGHPFLRGESVNHSLAIREFSEYFNNNKMMFNHSEDFSLFCLGEFDDSTGEFTNNNEFIISGEQFTVGKEK